MKLHILLSFPQSVLLCMAQSKCLYNLIKLIVFDQLSILLFILQEHLQQISASLLALLSYLSMDGLVASSFSGPLL